MSHARLEQGLKAFALLREASETLMLPKFGQLEQSQIKTKSDLSLVTEVDSAIEEFLSRELQTLFPGTQVVGEEAFEADQSSLEAITSGQAVWVVDPLDGTRAFATGRPGWGMLLALVENGVATMGVIYRPLTGDHIIAIKGEGVFYNDHKQARPDALKPLQEQTGLAWLSAIQPDILTAFDKGKAHFKDILPECTSCVELAFLMLQGKVDFVPSTHTQPWDFLALNLMMEELGGRAAKLTDGHGYTGARLTNVKEPGLLVRHAAQWQDIKDKLYAGISAERLQQGIRIQPR